jgi:hypothetical protein
MVLQPRGMHNDSVRLVCIAFGGVLSIRYTRKQDAAQAIVIDACAHCHFVRCSGGIVPLGKTQTAEGLFRILLRMYNALTCD